MSVPFGSSASPTSEASKLLEAALEQMDGIIQGAKFDLPQPEQSEETTEDIMSKSLDAGLPKLEKQNASDFFRENGGSHNLSVSDALRNLHSAIIRDSPSGFTSTNSDMLDVDIDEQEFVFNWLKNNLMISGHRLSATGKNPSLFIFSLLLVGPNHIGQVDIHI